jgi:NAD(P)-dependent dehydrogenase (short-subunit alcohol dehydrogenase family)
LCHPQHVVHNEQHHRRPGQRALRATKGGVNGLTKAAAIEAGKDKISVNALAFAASTSPGA